MKRLIGFLKRNDAQALAEFAVVFPVQLFITLAVVQLALVMAARDVVNNAAHTAARAALVGEDPQMAAALACSSITGPALGRRAVRYDPGMIGVANDGAEVGTSISFPHWSDPLPGDTGAAPPDVVLPGWGELRNSGKAQVKTHAHTLQSIDDNQADYVEVQVLYEYQLIMPVVNNVFSTHRIGGEPHLGIVRTARVPKPWANDEHAGLQPHPQMPDMTGATP